MGGEFFNVLLAAVASMDPVDVMAWLLWIIMGVAWRLVGWGA